MQKEKILVPKEREKEIKEAEKNFKELWENVRPFIKKKEIKTYSTAGKWRSFDHSL